MAEPLTLDELLTGLDKVAKSLEQTIPRATRENEKKLLSACAKHIREVRGRIETELPAALKELHGHLEEAQRRGEQTKAEIEKAKARLADITQQAAAKAAQAAAAPEALAPVLSQLDPDLGRTLREELLGKLFGAADEVPEAAPHPGKDIWEDWE